MDADRLMADARGMAYKAGLRGEDLEDGAMEGVLAALQSTDPYAMRKRIREYARKVRRLKERESRLL